MTLPRTPLVLHAPDDEATFLSLPYIESLLHLYRSSPFHSFSPYSEQPVSGQMGASSTSAATRRRLEVERACEEAYFQPQYANETPPNASKEGERAAVLLRIGLYRALGFALPNTTATDTGSATATAGNNSSGVNCTDPAAALDDRVLARHRHLFALHSPHAGPWYSEANGYCEESGEELRHTAFGEWFEDLLGFIVARDYSCVQARCVLVVAMGLLENIDALPADSASSETGDADIKKAATTFLQDAMSAQTCAVPTRVVESHVTFESVTREVPDPDMMAALEQKLGADKKLSKKQQIALAEQMAAVPLVARAVVEERCEEVEGERLVGPYFTVPEAATAMDYLVRSLLAHWRLVQYCMVADQQGCKTGLGACGNGGQLMIGTQCTPFAVSYEDVDTHCVPPLRAFVPANTHAAAAARNALWAVVEAAAALLYQETFAKPVAALAELAGNEKIAIRQAKEAADRANRAAALTASDMTRVQRAYTLRLHRAFAQEGGESAGGEPDATADPIPPSLPHAAMAATAPAVPSKDSATADAGVAATVTPSRPRSCASVRTANAKSRSAPGDKGGGKGGATAAPLPPLLAGESRVPPETIEVPADARFLLPAVEEKIDSVGAAVDALLADPKLMKKPKSRR